MIRNLSIITADFPTPGNPHRGSFVHQFAEAITRQGINCSVIKPVSIHKAYHELMTKGQSLLNCSRTFYRNIFYPLYLSVGYKLKIGDWPVANISQWQIEWAVKRCLQKSVNKTDILYGHFAYAGGAAAVRMGQLSGIPVFIGIGESTFEYLDIFGHQRVSRMFEKTTGVISVSSLVAQKLVGMQLVNPEKIGIFPNGINNEIFYPRDRKAVREELCIPKNLFVVAFVGRLTSAKGANRLAEAIDNLPGVGALFLGQGTLPKNCSNALHIGPVPHEQIPKYLSASDIFVLPTLSEGCCNAILEAMACGLPVISSMGEFNDDILCDEVSLRVDPNDISEIRSSIISLRDNATLRSQMSADAKSWSKQFDIDDRARNILSFMEEKTKNEIYS